MRLRHFTRNTRHQQLCDLYRSAEQGSLTVEADQPSSQAFEADQELITRLTQLAAQAEPADPALQRATLLARVARKKSQPEEEIPMIRQLLQKRTVAVVAAATLLLGGAVGVGATGGVSDVAGNVADVLAELNITDRTPDAAYAQIDAIQQPDGPASPDASGSAVDGMETANGHADDNASDGLGTAADAQNQEVDLPEEASGNAADGANNADDGAENGDVELPAAADAAANNADVDLPAEAEAGAANGDDNPSLPDEVPDGVVVPLP